MESDHLLLFLCGKSSGEKFIANFLSSNSNNNCQFQFPNTNANISLRLQFHLPRPTNASFNVDSFFTSLSTRRFGRFLIWSPRLPSTHDVVSHNFSKLPVGSVCVADVQFKGKGRSANVWESPPGCLMFSFTLQMEDGRIVPLVQYIASLALTEAIKDLCFNNGLPQLGVKIKWPNDLYLNGLKIGGVLCTSTYKSKKFNISVGIGLNVDNKQPTTCLNARLQQIASMSCQLRKEDILASFFNKFENFFDQFLSQGFKPLEELYYQTWLHSGQRVIVQETREGQTVDNAATIQGLTSSGYLLAIGDDGQMCELHPDGNRTSQTQIELKSALPFFFMCYYETEKGDLESTVGDESQKQSKEQGTTSRTKEDKSSEATPSDSDDDNDNDRADAAGEDANKDENAFFETRDLLSSSSFKSSSSDLRISSFSTDNDDFHAAETEEDVDPSIKDAVANFPYVKQRKKLPDPKEKERS